MTLLPAITIEREYGSGGGAVGRRLARTLDIPCYGVDLLEEAAVMAGITPREAYRLEEQSAAPLSRFISGAFQVIPGIDPEADYLYEIQAELIRSRAQARPAVFIGRLAPDALKDSDLDYIRIFITRPFDNRVNQIEKLNNLSPERARAEIKRIDGMREARVKYHSGRRWGDSREYDLTLNSDDLGEDGCIQVIKTYLLLRGKRRKARGIRTVRPSSARTGTKKNEEK